MSGQHSYSVPRCSRQLSLDVAVPTFFLLFVAMLLVLFMSVPRIKPGPWEHISLVALSFLSLFIPYLGARIVFSKMRSRTVMSDVPRCLNCLYSLIGNVRGRCPKCGTPIPKDVMEELEPTTSPTRDSDTTALRKTSLLRAAAACFAATAGLGFFTLAVMWGRLSYGLAYGILFGPFWASGCAYGFYRFYRDVQKREFFDGIIHCRECGYLLRELTKLRCPECGTQFRPLTAPPKYGLPLRDGESHGGSDA